MQSDPADADSLPGRRTIWRRLVWVWSFLVLYEIAGWYIFGYGAGGWARLALYLGCGCLAIGMLRPRQQRVWMTLTWLGIGANLLYLVGRFVS